MTSEIKKTKDQIKAIMESDLDTEAEKTKIAAAMENRDLVETTGPIQRKKGIIQFSAPNASYRFFKTGDVWNVKSSSKILATLISGSGSIDDVIRLVDDQVGDISPKVNKWYSVLISMGLKPNQVNAEIIRTIYKYLGNVNGFDKERFMVDTLAYLNELRDYVERIVEWKAVFTNPEAVRPILKKLEEA